ncbi:hypothetical protein BN2476_110072 [Paraburkholderia piptadeniae]|uniref:Uncharacterized protein n=1 Tax=Paraburkholderia piptadeniae TaxID=1701573 RepID=A0A1N7RPJ7_9BURK|nr:hypothetical protein BN2476_110072 [Paraburkholderia piptadeniae]
MRTAGAGKAVLFPRDHLPTLDKDFGEILLISTSSPLAVRKIGVPMRDDESSGHGIMPAC